MRTKAILSVVGLTITCWATPLIAVTFTVYTDQTEWQNALGGQYLTESFADAQLNTGISYVSTESGHINPAQECYQDVLASQSQNEPTTIWSFSPQIIAYGGNWTLGGPGGSGNNLLVYIADLSLYVGAISNDYNGGFWGFISDTPFTSVRLTGGSGSNQQNYSLDDMVYSPVPDLTILISAASRKNHGSAGPFDLNLPLDPPSSSAIEGRSGGPTTVILTFNRPVNEVDVQASAATVGAITIIADEAIVELSGVPNATCISLSIVTAPPLAGDSNVHIRTLAGDANGDGATNILDLVTIRNSLNAITDSTSFPVDINVDGSISILDLVQTRNVLNTSAESCP